MLQRLVDGQRTFEWRALDVLEHQVAGTVVLADIVERADGSAPKPNRFFQVPLNMRSSRRTLNGDVH